MVSNLGKRSPSTSIMLKPAPMPGLPLEHSQLANNCRHPVSNSDLPDCPGILRSPAAIAHEAAMAVASAAARKVLTELPTASWLQSKAITTNRAATSSKKL